MARRKFFRDDRGGVSVIAAAGSMMLVGFSAMAVDLGSVFLQARRLQGAADLAAMAAARDLDNAQTAADATAQANSWGAPLSVAVTKGRYVQAADVPPAERFQPGAAQADAAHVKLAGEAQLFFGQMLIGRPTWTITREATAARADLASFSIGTRLASLNGGVANSLLSSLTGSQVNLSVMDYNALIDADVDLFSYLDAVATELKVTGVSYDQLLSTKLTTGQALSALSALLAKTGDVRASAAVRALAVSAGNKTKTSLDVLFDVGPYGQQSRVAGGSAAAVSLAAMDLSSTLLRLASGERQVELDLGAAVPGLADVDVWLAIGEPANSAPWMTITSSKTVVVRTAQARLYLEAKVGGSGLLSAAEIKLPVYLEAASGEAKLNTLDCQGGSATLDVRPGLGSLAVGEIDRDQLDDFKTPLTVSAATIAKTPILTATARSEVKIGGLAWKPVRFSQSEARARTVKTVATTDIAKATVSSLIGGLSLNVQVLGLGLGLGQGPLTATLASILSGAAAPLDDVINSLTGLLGVRLGEADVQMNGLRCRDAALVA
jgi:uncharacterized membrane protein